MTDQFPDMDFIIVGGEPLVLLDLQDMISSAFDAVPKCLEVLSDLPDALIAVASPSIVILADDWTKAVFDQVLEFPIAFVSICSPTEIGPMPPLHVTLVPMPFSSESLFDGIMSARAYLLSALS